MILDGLFSSLSQILVKKFFELLARNFIRTSSPATIVAEEA
jgi:hypothetical protein